MIRPFPRETEIPLKALCWQGFVTALPPKDKPCLLPSSTWLPVWTIYSLLAVLA